MCGVGAARQVRLHYDAVMQLLVASSNPHKVEEIGSILGAAGVMVMGLGDLPEQPPEPVEDGGSFEENARIKAVAYARATGRMCIADDSGLEVDALGGQPGVHSARFAEVSGVILPRDATRGQRDEANNRVLLEKLRDVPREQRAARFVCVMCVADPRGEVVLESRGTMEGVITDQPRGGNGFGYDPLLELADGRTSAELSPEEKNACSHRGAALRDMVQQLRMLGGGRSL